MKIAIKLTEYIAKKVPNGIDVTNVLNADATQFFIEIAKEIIKP